MTAPITVSQQREHDERRGAEAGEQDSVLDCLVCGRFYREGDYHRCARNSDGVGLGWAS